MTRPDFPLYIDSTMRSSFVSCRRKFFNEYMMNRRADSGNGSIHLTAGKAFAAGLEYARMAYWAEGKTKEESLAIGIRKLIESYGDPERFEDKPKNLGSMIGALDAFFLKWGWDDDHFIPYTRPDGSPAIEFSFAIPLEGTAHPVTCDPLIYCGRADWIGVHRDTGLIYAVDEKTTSRLGATWPQQWRHRAQLTGYVWAGQTMGIDIAGALIRGISITKEFGHAESLQLREKFYIERWHEQLVSDVKSMVQCWESGQWDYNFSDSCNAFMSPCTYSDSCGSSRPEQYLTSNFEHLRWNPLKHQVERLDDEDNVIEVVE